jgi:hypothetical protein
MTNPARHLVIPEIRGTVTATQAEADLAEHLARWMEDEAIAKGETTRAVAGTLVQSGWAVREFGGGSGSAALRDAAGSLALDAELDAGEWRAEQYWHGHGND